MVFYSFLGLYVKEDPLVEDRPALGFRPASFWDVASGPGARFVAGGVRLMGHPTAPGCPVVVLGGLCPMPGTRCWA